MFKIKKIKFNLKKRNFRWDSKLQDYVYECLNETELHRLIIKYCNSNNITLKSIKIFFWNGIFSNWYPCKFTYNNVEFNCSEQALMYEKAILFKDQKTAQRILEAKTPKEQKALGRLVKNYNENIWSKNREKIMTDILLAKFTSKNNFKNEMMKYKNYQFVEASPVDRIWGIGLHEDNELIKDETNWRGQNLLGKALTKVCNQINNMEE